MKLKFKEDVKSWNAKYLLKRAGWKLMQELAVARGLPNVIALELTTECTRRCWLSLSLGGLSREYFPDWR